jgi:polysaccharide export outer membrane protein
VALAPVAPVAAGIVWTIEPNDLLKVKVFRDPELSSEPLVNEHGIAYFPGVGRLDVSGLTRDSLELLLNARYGATLREPAVQVTLQRELTVQGQVRSPGIYAVDAGTTLTGLMVKAGGQSTSGAAVDVTLDQASGRRLRLPREARLGALDIHRSDAIMVLEQGFFARNGNSIYQSTVILAALSSIIGLVSLLTR